MISFQGNRTTTGHVAERRSKCFGRYNIPLAERADKGDPTHPRFEGVGEDLDAAIEAFVDQTIASALGRDAVQRTVDSDIDIDI